MHIFIRLLQLFMRTHIILKINITYFNQIHQIVTQLLIKAYSCDIYLVKLMEYIDQINDTIKPLINKGLVEADKYFALAEIHLNQHVSGMRQLNNFWRFIGLNIFLIGILILLRLIPFLNPFAVYRKVVRIFFSLPFIQNKVEKDLQKMKQEFIASYPDKHRAKLTKIPYQPVKDMPGNQSDLLSLKGYLSGSRYPEKRHSDFVSKLSKQFSYSNPLHFDLHPYLKQMEIQVIKMSASMLNFYSEQKEAVGGFFSGGTQSILMAILSYRQYGRRYKGIKNPNIVICDTGHAAALKAADLFDIQIRKVKTNSKYEMNISAMKSAINSDTICVYASYPNYPYGTVDPINQIAYICNKKSVPIHLDMCLGGFLVPFLKNNKGEPLLTIPHGVTSISLDCHKYGLSAKGASVLLFSSEKYRRQHFFVTKQWPGGYYGTLGIAGSRPGTSIASSWISMMKMGNKGFTKNAKNIQNATIKLAQELRKHDFKIFGNPEICCIGFSHPRYSTTLIRNHMREKQWDIPIIQKPKAMHYSFTPLNSIKIDQMIQDLQDTMVYIKKLYESGKVDAKADSYEELYGACAAIPNIGTKQTILNNVLDLFYDV